MVKIHVLRPGFEVWSYDAIPEVMVVTRETAGEWSGVVSGMMLSPEQIHDLDMLVNRSGPNWRERGQHAEVDYASSGGRNEV